MAKAKTARTPKSKLETNKNVLQMPENTNGNGVNPSSADFEAEIRLRAYEIYEERGCEPGQDEKDWLAAEREVLSRQSTKKHLA